MSDTTENTNELDSYGVWVKNNNQEDQTDDLNFAESLDLPDFEESDSLEDSDFNDMFKEDDSVNLATDEDDTTLSEDELLNITSGDGIQIEETSAEENTDLDDISFDSLEENSVSDADLSSFEDVSIEESVPQEEESAIDDFSFDEVTEDTTEEPAVEDVAIPEDPVAEEETPVVEDSGVEEMNIEDFGVDSSESSESVDEEISLDDFMDSGFSDESVASGNNGFAADEVPSAGGSEEVSLDDFVDMSEFGIEEEAPKKEEVIADEKPLDMSISFDSSADTIPTEENDTEAIPDDDDDDFQEEDFTATEEPEAAVETEVRASTGNDIESEEVDLSDFGIDADAEETPVTQDVEGEKSKETVVDYDLSVGDGNMNAAPVVNEIKSSAPEDAIEDIAEVEEVAEVVEEPAAAPVDNSLLQQIVADLSSLKEEINTLKNNLEEIKSSPAPVAESSGVISEEIAVDEPVIEEDSSKEDTGFFSGDDGDDTIALSTDELSNILNTADFSENEEVEATPEDDFAVEAPAEEPAVEEETVEEPFATEEPVVEEETIVEEEPVIEETSIEDEEVGQEVSEEAIGAISDETSDISFDFEEENLSEPNLDEIEIDEDVLEDDLPEEIEITKDDDILVESSTSDFMDSVQDTTDEHEPEDTLDSPDDIIEETVEEPVVEETFVEEETPVVEETAVEEDTFSTVDNLFDQDNTISEENGFAADTEVIEETPVVEETFEEEPVVEEPVVEEEPIIEETAVEEPVVEETDDTIVETTPFMENDFVSHEDDNNELTDSNIDYLTTEDEKSDGTVDENAELKKDIKSVLLYMDQLLENLPEEKIVEFAKSDEFTTYKKLFSELGLS